MRHSAHGVSLVQQAGPCSYFSGNRPARFDPSAYVPASGDFRDDLTDTEGEEGGIEDFVESLREHKESVRYFDLSAIPQKQNSTRT